MSMDALPVPPPRTITLTLTDSDCIMLRMLLAQERGAVRERIARCERIGWPIPIDETEQLEAIGRFLELFFIP